MKKKGFLFNQAVAYSLLSSLLMLNACAVHTSPTTAGERASRAQLDKESLFMGQEQIKKPLTLYEALARAVKYNSASRIALMEQALILGLADYATVDMLPTLAVAGGFDSRSNKLGVKPESIRTGFPSLDPSYIGDKNTATANMQIVYNVLDFGVSTATAKQMSDRVFISEETRRKSMQRIVHDVRLAFWKAAAAQRIAKDLDVLIKATQDELARLKADPLDKAPLPELDRRKALLMALQELNALQQETLTAKADLAQLMNLPPSAPFVLDIPPEMDTQSVLKDLGPIDLEHFALINRPELRINDYEARILALEARKEFLRSFPGLEFGLGVNYDSNTFLYDQNWVSAGMRVSWNLMNLFTRPKAIENAKNRENLDREKRIAMTMAVMSQVNIAYLNLRQSAKTFEVSTALDTVNEYVWQKKYNANTEKQEKLFAAVTRVSSQLKRDFAYAEYKNAESSLFLTLGVDPLPQFSQNATVNALAETLEDNLSRNAPEGFKEVSYDRLTSDTAKKETLTEEQRLKIQQIQIKNEAFKNKEPVNLLQAKQATQKRASKVENKNLSLLQMSSFEDLTKAQKRWQELLLIDPSLKIYAPVFKEVNVSKIGIRFRTFIADSPQNLEKICLKLKTELRSCLIQKPSKE